MNKNIFLLVLLFAASTLFISCGDNEVTNPIAVESVTLSPIEFSIAMGAPAVQLTFTVHPSNATNRAVAFTSGNENIARVNAQGAVTAVAVGTTYITVITADGAHTNRTTVTVTPVPIAVTSVTLAGCDADTPLAIGSTRQLTATVLPETATNRAVTWSSNNTNVATVDVNSGLVTAVTAGNATITVTTADGGRYATCVVTVEEIPDISTSITGVVINGIRWATRNVDLSTANGFANNPEDAGMFFQWNRNRGWSTTNPLRHWANDAWREGGWNSTTPIGNSWATANDPCPPGWRVPTQAQLQSLNNAGSIWTQRNGVNGRLFGTAPNQIFLPAVGYRHNSNGALHYVGTNGGYWSSALLGSTGARYLWFSSGSSSVRNRTRANGFSVRCVAE